MSTSIGWNEIKNRATQFTKEWKGETREAGGYQVFWHQFFEVFGIRSRSVAIYQQAVKRLSGNTGFIDLFWPGTLIVEHKSAGESLDSAFIQATGYATSLSEEEHPRFIIVTDYKNIRLYDLEGKNGKTNQYQFSLEELPKNIRLFGFITGYEIREYKEENPVNRKAVKLIVQLYRALRSGVYPKEYLSRLMVRLVFCFFADDTGIFQKDSLYKYLLFIPRVDGSDFGAHLGTVFQILNTPENERQTNLDEDLASLPYVNGGLFSEPVPLPFFNSDMRKEVLKVLEFDWGSVSPAIFGSMFQFVMEEDSKTKRHDIGAHYTSERNILKVIDGLFLDELKNEFEGTGKSRSKLTALWDRISNITLLDPACGCGNFLVVAYRELRRLELEIIKRLYSKEINELQHVLQFEIDASKISKMSVERMYGIEIEGFPAEIAKLSLWLVDHLANMELGDLFGKPFAKLPLIERPHILCANALTTDWEKIVPRAKLSYILGNPPFISKQDQTKEQKSDMALVFGKLNGAGELDYVAAWYKKAGEYIQSTNIKCAFVSTNSITQGEQVGILWNELMGKYSIKIHFAHRTFKWTNEAPGRAAVHCVIIGFGPYSPKRPRLWDYDETGESKEIEVKNINPYLVDAPNIIILSRRKPISKVPEARFGSMPNDRGFLLFDDAKSKDEFIAKEPGAKKYIRHLIAAKEYLNGQMRYCLWLKDAPMEEIRRLPEVMRRIEAVRTFRLLSKRKATNKLAEAPYLFGEDRQPNADYVLIPLTSSENRKYIPFSFFDKNYIANNTCAVISNATLYHFGVLESEMHMAWMRSVCGRMKSDYRYSNELVYNNFPWPENVSDEDRKEIEKAAQRVLDDRTLHAGATLADLYDPLTMPKDLLDAHKSLDRAVDHAYGVHNFENEPKRLEFLFDLYQKYIDQENANKPEKTKSKKK